MSMILTNLSLNKGKFLKRVDRSTLYDKTILGEGQILTSTKSRKGFPKVGGQLRWTKNNPRYKINIVLSRPNMVQ